MRKAPSLALLGAALVLGACSSVPPKPKVPMLDVDITWLQAGAGAPTGPFTYGFVPPSGDEPLVDEGFAGYLGKELDARGATLDAQAPQWVFKVTHSVSEAELNLPDKHHRETYWKDGQTYEVLRQHRNGTVTEQLVNTQGSWHEKTVSEPGGSRTIYRVKVSLQAFVAPYMPDALPRWEGSITDKQAVPEPLKRGELLMHELMKEFPAGSGEPGQRKVPLR